LAACDLFTEFCEPNSRVPCSTTSRGLRVSAKFEYEVDERNEDSGAPESFTDISEVRKCQDGARSCRITNLLITCGIRSKSSEEGITLGTR